MKPQILFKWSYLLPILLVSIIFTFSPFLSFSQIQPGIGIESLPDDNEPICTIPTVASNPNGGGPIVGEEVQDFTLYQANGQAHRLSDELNSGTPVLLISGSLTCPVFRDRIPEINAMASAYGDLLKIFIIYTVEAHPIDPSPYSGSIWITLQNEMSQILYPQPTTYGERKALVDTLNNLFEIDVPILIDAPCNNWWLNFGTGANNAFLINTDGRVYAKHDWFNQLQINMACPTDTLTSFFSGLCLDIGNLGTFSYEIYNDSIDIGSTGETLAIQGMIYNNSMTDYVVLDILKLEYNLPQDWETALCTDLCYESDVDSIRMFIPPASQQEFIFYFYTSNEISSGDVLVLMRNVYVANRVYQRFYGETENTAGQLIYQEVDFTVYPNPTSEYCMISDYEQFGQADYEIFNSNGQVVLSGELVEKINFSELTSGQYTLIIQGTDTYGIESIIVQ